LSITTKIKGCLLGGDLRSIGVMDKLIPNIKTQSDFDALFEYLHSDDRLLVMRAADAVEKITIKHPEFLQNHKRGVIEFFETAEDKEFKWHLAQLVPRLPLSAKELKMVWNKLTVWATDKKGSKIVRVNSIQTLFDLSENYRYLKKDFRSVVQTVEKENVPSINARIGKLKTK